MDMKQAHKLFTQTVDDAEATGKAHLEVTLESGKKYRFPLESAKGQPLKLVEISEHRVQIQEGGPQVAEHVRGGPWDVKDIADITAC